MFEVGKDGINILVPGVYSIACGFFPEERATLCLRANEATLAKH